MNLPENMTLQETLEKKQAPSPTTDLRQKFEWPGRIFILLAIVVSPWLFGSVYFSGKFFITFCMLVGMGFLWFESCVTERKSLILPYLLVPMLIGNLIVLLQIVPLPSAFEWMLGKQVDLYPVLTGDPAAYPSISMSRSDTWDQLGLLMVAFAAVCAGSRYFRTSGHVKLLLTTITVNCVALGLFGIIQSLTREPGYIYWTIELLNGGNPFGPYINRNSGAGYLLMGFGASLGLAAMTLASPQRGPKSLGTKDLPFWTQFNNHLLRFIADLDAIKVASILAPIVIGASIICSLSRGGVLALLIGAVATLLLYGMARRPSFSAFIFIPSVGIAVLLAFWLGMGEQLLKRFEDVQTVDVMSQKDARIQHWIDTFPAVADFGIFGSGVGAYDEVHRIYHSGMMQSKFRYAESVFFQTLVELGWPGFVLLLSAVGLMLYMSLFLLYRGVSASTVALGTAGVFTIISVSVASLFDFGLYMPASMLTMSVFCGFIAFHAHSLSTRLVKSNWLRFETPNVVSQVLLLVTVAALAMYSVDFYRKWQVQSAINEFPIQKFALDNPTLPETDKLIEQISPLVHKTRYSAGTNYMARLLIHRSRLQLFEKLLTSDPTAEPEKHWERTTLDMMHENASAMRQDGEIFSMAEFLRSDFIVENLPWARQYFRESRSIDPMESQTHFFLGQLNALIGTNQLASEDLERAITLAPYRHDLKFAAGVYYLQTGNTDQAALHLRDLLSVAPRKFGDVTKLLFGRANRSVSLISDTEIVEKVMPDDAKLLLSLANRWLPKDSVAYQTALRKADAILVDLSASDIERLKTKADIKMRLEKYVDALNLYESILNSDPRNYAIQVRVAELAYKMNSYEEAIEKLDYVIRMSSDPKMKKRAENLRNEVEESIRQEKAAKSN